MRYSVLRSKTRAVCLALLLSAVGTTSATAKFTRLIVVNPTGTPQANGIALLNALDSIPSSGPGTEGGAAEDIAVANQGAIVTVAG